MAYLLWVYPSSAKDWQTIWISCSFEKVSDLRYREDSEVAWWSVKKRFSNVRARQKFKYLLHEHFNNRIEWSECMECSRSAHARAICLFTSIFFRAPTNQRDNAQGTIFITVLCALNSGLYICCTSIYFTACKRFFLTAFNQSITITAYFWYLCKCTFCQIVQRCKENETGVFWKALYSASRRSARRYITIILHDTICFNCCFPVFASQGARSLVVSPENVMSPEQYTAAERQHEKDIMAAKQLETCDEQGLRLSMEQLREVSSTD